MSIADTSLVVAAFASWHEDHEAARRALDGVAATAAGFDAELVTCDRRALPIYERYGVRTRLVS